MQTTVLIVIGITAIIAVNLWAAQKDTERNVAANAYEQCVQREYHMSPSQWYEQNHKYPLCGN